MSTVHGRPSARAFPAWSTLPRYQDLATGRVWHFFFAWVFVINGLIYLVYATFSGHLFRNVVPGRQPRSDRASRGRWRALLRRPQPAPRYSPAQKVAYLFVVLVLLPLMLATGLTMSPAVNAAAPWMLDLFGGRQSARTIHFIITVLLTLFVAGHVAMVLVSGCFNRMRAMITGWYAVSKETVDAGGAA